MNYLVLDIENDNSNKYGRDAGNFKYDDIVAFSLKYPNKEPYHYYKKPFNPEFYLRNTEILVGHNIKHDLLFLWWIPGLQEWIIQGGKIWDTASVEYMLTGQQHQYPKLRDIAVNKYGCPEREKKMEEYWNKKLQTSEIPKNIIEFDCNNDVLDTEVVFLKQVEEVKKQNMLALVLGHMDALLATTEMEYNGIYLDNDIRIKETNILEPKIKQQEIDFLKKIEKYV